MTFSYALLQISKNTSKKKKKIGSKFGVVKTAAGHQSEGLTAGIIQLTAVILPKNCYNQTEDYRMLLTLAADTSNKTKK